MAPMSLVVLKFIRHHPKRKSTFDSTVHGKIRFVRNKIRKPLSRAFLPPALNRAKAQHACVLRPPERGGAGCQSLIKTPMTGTPSSTWAARGSICGIFHVAGRYTIHKLDDGVQINDSLYFAEVKCELIIPHILRICVGLTPPKKH